jgi:thiamine-monophosphate kinase
MADLLGFSDYYYWGWLLSTINLSDLAAAGADPAGLLTSLVLPSDLPVEGFERLLAGIDECCSTVGACVIGGNLKEGSGLELTGTAIGLCDGPPLSRSGAEPGHSVMVIGDLGHFWAGYFALTRNLSLPEHQRTLLLKNVLTPVPKVLAAAELRRAGLLCACIDNSDGLYPSLIALGGSNSLQIRLNFSDVSFDPAVIAVAQSLGIDPVRLALGWGDWQLITAVSPNDLTAVEMVCSRLGLRSFAIGTFREGHGVVIDHDGGSGPLMPLDSQRFSIDSWFETGVDAYARFMLDSSLYGKP